jgi:hypothetical protein
MRQNDVQLPESKFTGFFATGLLIAPPGIFSQRGGIQIEAIIGRK